MLKNAKTPDGYEVGSDGRILEKYNNNFVNDITGVIKNAMVVTPHADNSDTSSNTIANSNNKYKNGVRAFNSSVGEICLIGHKVGDIVEESGVDVFGKFWTAWYEILAIYDERPW